MIRKNINLILLVLLVCQLFLIALLYLPGAEKGQPMVELVPGLAADSVVELSITDANTTTLILKRKSDGNWLVDDGGADKYPADASQIHHIVDNLTALQSQRLVTRTRSSHIRLQVDDKVFAKKLVLRGKDGNTQTLFLGSTSGPQTIHVRPQTTDDVYLVKGISTWNLDTDKASWWQKGYVMVDSKQLHEVSLQNSHGSFTLHKEGDKWLIDGDETPQEAEPASLDNFLRQVSHIIINSYMGKDYQGKALDTAKLTLTTDKESITVNIGPQKSQDDDEHIIKSSTSPFFAYAGDYQVAPLLKIKKADLLPQEERE